jgi:hypothetical protein
MGSESKKETLQDLLESSEKCASPAKRRFPKLHSILSELGTSVDKFLKFAFSAVALGAFDASNNQKTEYFQRVGAYIQEKLPGIFNTYFPFFGSVFLYQTILMLSDAGLASWSLYDKRWQKKRNLSNLLMAIPHAVCMDYSSAAIQSKRLYALPLPKSDFMWRIRTYQHTPLAGLANWLDEPSRLLHGAIQGYDLGIYLTIGYVGSQALISIYNYVRLNKSTKS